MYYRDKYMRHDIELFLTKMQDILSEDLIKHIVYIVGVEKNIQTIKRQRQYKVQLNKDIIKLFNTYYYDNNFILYKNEHNQFILENMAIKNKQIYVYSNKPIESQNEIVESNQNQLVLHNQSSADTSEQIVLFENPSNQDLYDDNGFPIQRRIKLDIVYVL